MFSEGCLPRGCAGGVCASSGVLSFQGAVLPGGMCLQGRVCFKVDELSGRGGGLVCFQGVSVQEEHLPDPPHPTPVGRMTDRC